MAPELLDKFKTRSDVEKHLQKEFTTTILFCTPKITFVEDLYQKPGTFVRNCGGQLMRNLGFETAQEFYASVISDAGVLPDFINSTTGKGISIQELAAKIFAAQQDNTHDIY